MNEIITFYRGNPWTIDRVIAKRFDITEGHIFKTEEDWWHVMCADTHRKLLICNVNILQRN